MRMEDSPISVETMPVVVPEATVAGAAAPAAAVVKGGATHSSGGFGSLAANTPPPVPDEKLHGKDLLEALKKQVGCVVVLGRVS